MPVGAVVLFVFAVVASAGLFAFGFRLRLSYRARHLDLYFYFLVATVSYGFVNWVGLPFYSSSPELAAVDAPPGGLIIFVSSALFLVLVKLCLFVAFLFALLGERMPRILVRAFVGFGAATLAISAYLIARDLQAGALERLRPFLLLLGVLILAMDYLAIGFFLSKTSRIASPLGRAQARRFGWAYLLGYVVYSTPFYTVYWWGASALLEAVPYLYYLMHFPPMIPLRRLSESQEALAGPLPSPARDLGPVIRRHGISEREAAVLELVLAGQKNEDVARHLCISPHTVRNHLYSIYGKMGVANRIQLLAACSEERLRGG